MMELIELRFVKISSIFLMVALYFSCQQNVQEGRLECLLESINVDLNEVEILVGQANGWTDTTALIMITFHNKSIKIPIGSRFKSTYRGYDIFFNQGNIDSTDTKKYSQIPNNIKWKKHIPKEIDEDYIVPPYNPIQVHIEYNVKRNCFGDVVRGKGLIKEKNIQICKCD